MTRFSRRLMLADLSFDKRRLYLLLGVMLLVSACGANLAGEPDVIATLRPPSQQEIAAATNAVALQPVELPPEAGDGQQLGYPLTPPSMLRGAEIYADRCAACHGIEGLGDGPLFESGQLTVRPPDFTDPATAYDQSPQEWFTTITNGRLENFMPPWGSELSEEDRWAVALYTYTLAYEPADLRAGERVYRSACTECHGESGRGDGPRAAEINRPINDLTQQSTIVTLSDATLVDVATDGIGATMPAFGDSLSTDELKTIAQHIRTLGLAEASVIRNRVRGQPITTEEPQPPPTEVAATDAPPQDQPGDDAATRARSTNGAQAITVSGQVTNGTAGGTLPDDLMVTLHQFDADFVDRPVEMIPDSDGNFNFDDITIDPQSQYFVSTDYRERFYATNILPGELFAQEADDLALKIYELTEDPSVIVSDRMVTQITAVGEGLQVLQVINFVNTSDRLFTSSTDVGNNRFASVSLELPPGAVLLGFPGSEQRYVTSEDQSLVVDTLPLLPGLDHIFQVIYFMPYDGGAIIDQVLGYDFEGPVRVLINPATVELTSDQLVYAGTELIGQNNFESYGASLTLRAGNIVRYELRGDAAEGASGVVSSSGSIEGGSLLLIGIVLLMGGGMFIGAIIYLRRQSSQDALVNKDKLIDALVQQIAELDAEHQRGEINHDVYQRRRQKLKARLAQLMGDDEDA